jgi:hypothetical protein
MGSPATIKEAVQKIQKCISRICLQSAEKYTGLIITILYFPNSFKIISERIAG